MGRNDDCSSAESSRRNCSIGLNACGLDRTIVRTVLTASITSVRFRASVDKSCVAGGRPLQPVFSLEDAMIEALVADSVRLKQMGRAGALRVVRQHDPSA
jgi:hypothetical protein